VERIYLCSTADLNLTLLSCDCTRTANLPRISPSLYVISGAVMSITWVSTLSCVLQATKINRSQMFRFPQSRHIVQSTHFAQDYIFAIVEATCSYNHSVGLHFRDDPTLGLFRENVGGAELATLDVDRTALWFFNVLTGRIRRARRARRAGVGLDRARA
jgi:hypothetical protein